MKCEILIQDSEYKNDILLKTYSGIVFLTDPIKCWTGMYPEFEIERIKSVKLTVED